MSHTPLLQVENLSVQFRQGEQQMTAVESLSFSVAAGETVALVGESGSGKSVSALSILQLLPYPAASHPSGRILFQGESLLDMNSKQIRQWRGNRIGFIFQEPLTALNPLHTIEKQLAEILQLHRPLSGKALRQRILELLEAVQLQQPETKLRSYPHQLSGGQRQRVMIAMAIANEPDLLIADEPTTALDVTVQAEILSLLKDLQQQLGMAMLLITHDLGIVSHVADRVLVMKAGRLIETADVKTLFSTPQHEYTRQLIEAEPEGLPRPLQAEAPRILDVPQLTVDYPLGKRWFFQKADYFRAVDRASFELRQGETLGIVGESGSGKSTLAMAILRLIDSQGAIHFRQQDLTQLSAAAMRPLRRYLQVVFQDPFGSLSPRMSISDIIAEGLKIHANISSEALDQRVIEVMREVGLDPDSRFRYPHEFSGGQRQRIAIARALILQPSLIVLDEPSSALDRSIQIQILALLKQLQQKHGLSFLFISHDLAVVKSISHRVLVMQNGKIVEQGDNPQLFQQPQQAYTRRLLEAAKKLSLRQL